MFTIDEVRVLTCEEKDWSINGKSGNYYPTDIRIGNDIFSVSSKVDLRDEIDQTVSLVMELQAKTPKTGQPYTGVRIIQVSR